jgi:hypothetical protein
LEVRVRSLEYKWVALSNTTLGMLIATINASILLIALPDMGRRGVSATSGSTGSIPIGGRVAGETS